MAADRKNFWRRHPWLIWVTAVASLGIIALASTLAVLAHRFEPFLRARLIDGLQDRFHTRIELDTFHVALGNGLHGDWGIWATGGGLRIWPPQHTGGDHPLETAVQSQPIIQLGEFRFHVPVRFKTEQPLRISLVRLKGLDIRVPPRSERDRQTGFESATQSSPSTPQPPSPTPAAGSSGSGMLSHIVVERIECEPAHLVLETDKPDKLPLEFDIRHLELKHLAAGEQMEFTAELTNPKPAGIIHTTGKLGPWQPSDLGATVIAGSYTFDHADLSVFKGIAGILNSTGSYSGMLRALVADGDATVPDFRLTHFGNPLALHTRFHARIDGTNGDTWLDSVDAMLGHSHFTTTGQIVRVRIDPATGMIPVNENLLPPSSHAGGHLIDLKVNVDGGRIEDFLTLASRSQTPILTGAITTSAVLHIAPGHDPVHQRMRLDGTFKLDQARFTSEKIEGRIRELSLRGQGHPDELKSAYNAPVECAMQGEFHMANAVITMPTLNFTVPGADVQLQGRYELEGFMHFSGAARIQATVSQMVGGWKGFLLKPADRFFRKDGAGTLVPIEIRGPHDAPEFSVDFGRMKNSSPETPGQKSPSSK